MTAIVLAAARGARGLHSRAAGHRSAGHADATRSSASARATSRRRFRSAARKEVGKLARTMEDMRNNLVELTGDAAPARGRSAGGARRHRRGRVRSRQVARHSLSQSAGGAAARRAGARSDRALLRRRAEALPRERPAAVRDALPDPARARRRQCAGDRAAGLSDGAPRTTIITSAAPVDDLQVQVIRDETELEGVRRARDSVLANISHEFRTPLAAQLASIELLREGSTPCRASSRRSWCSRWSAARCV